ncbi:hypothetical protein BS47DRAFT_1483978 [Hydnum rufescens UP504]|uniref:Uncharacterized protein n=1 Tax=Hydnum rufescens UP504 TaxID=1448309 RepID=A0A9P6B2W8_9AGAM|nr:hypothetical protein BS47DRAFT_1483978 [Hydnum rufescens UP504]
MPSLPSEGTSALLQRLLTYARDPSAASDEFRERLMGDCFTIITNSNERETVESATFLIRLHAYNSAKVPEWKKQCARIIHSCYDCNLSYQRSKAICRRTYLSDYPDRTLDTFFASVDAWEFEIVSEAINDARLVATSPGVIPLPILYHILVNIFLLQHPSLFDVLCTQPLPEQLDGWPRTPPPGMVLLLVTSNNELRTWAEKVTPLMGVIDTVDPQLSTFIQKLICRLSGNPSPGISIPSFLLEYTLPTPELWDVLPGVLHLLSTNATKSLNSMEGCGLARLVLSHLSDTIRFEGVLKSFTKLAISIGGDLWKNESPEYPEVIIDSIKDNATILGYFSHSKGDPWALDWLQPYLESLWKEAAFANCLAKAFVFLGEELQHASYSAEAHVQASSTLFQILAALHVKAQDASAVAQAKCLRGVCNTHASVICDTAFGRRTLNRMWSGSRTSARELVEQIFNSDVSRVISTLHNLCSAQKEHEAFFKMENAAVHKMSKTSSSSKVTLGQGVTTSAGNFQPFPRGVSIHIELWKSAYAALSVTDADGTAVLVRSVSKTAHIECLPTRSGSAFAFSFLKSDVDLRNRFVRSAQSINAALDVMRSGFAAQVERFAESSGGPLLQQFLRNDDLVASIIHIMLSPTDDLNRAAKVLALNAYDTVERSACYFSFFERHPTSSFVGVTSYLRVFNQHAELVPDACGASKYLVRSLTEILGGLCDPSGLLSKPDYGASENLNFSIWIPRLWKLMTQSLSIIFRRVKAWAAFYSNEEMVIWMRDALIFGRDMVAQVEVLQVATTLSASARPPTGITQGSALITDLQNVLTQLIEWLKLTDEETLHQSHELLKSLLGCFASSGIPPNMSSIEYLERIVERQKGTKTQLGDAKLRELLRVIEPFIEGDPGIPEPQITASRPAKSTPIRSESLKSGSDDEVEYLGSNTIPKNTKDVQKAAWAKVLVTDGVKALGNKAYVSLPPRPSSAFKSTISSKGDIVKRRSVTLHKGKATTAASYKPKPGDEPAEVAIRNYRLSKQHEPKNEGSVPRRPSIPVESSDDTTSTGDTDEGDGDDALAALRQKRISPKKVAKAERRQIKVLGHPYQAVVQERLSHREEARRSEMRLKPDLRPFHHDILQWDYDHEGPDPPNLELHLTHVPDKFPPQNPIEDYLKVFKPLILLETWSSLIKSKEEDIPFTIAEVVGRRHVDAWLDLDVVINEVVPPKWYLSETDITLLRPVDGTKSVLAKVSMSRRSPAGIQTTLRCSFTTPLNDQLVIGSRWRLYRVLSLSTVHREYAAMVGLQYYDLFPSVVHPRKTELPIISPNRVRNCMATYRVNEPQALAILGSLDTQGFSLIQGPPGTGKTSTIIGLVGMFLTSRSTPATAIHPGRPSKAEDRDAVKKMLICAPSNAAIDEVAQRLKLGVRNGSGSVIIPNIVRIGHDEKMHPSIKDVSLDELVSAKLSKDPKAMDLSGLREALKEIKNKIQARGDELHGLEGNPSRAAVLEQEISSLKNERAKLGRKLDEAKDTNININRNRDSNLRKWEHQVLRDADIICTTLSGSGHNSLVPFVFETVIIDEAAQSIELSSLIPLKYRCTQCILVGDPMQLAPTVLSPRATKYLYNQSLFVRLQKQTPAYLLRSDRHSKRIVIKTDVYIASIQYRMHPEISILPSKLFYNGRLRDGDDMARKRTMPWHSNTLFKPYQFFDVVDGREETSVKGHSQFNRAEIKVALALYDRIRVEYSAKVDLDYRIGIITMYDAQKRELQKQFSLKYSQDILKRIDFGTVDGFQGQEKDIIMVSCVRAGPNVQRIGHLMDTRRMNVAMTRAKTSLFVLGNASTLERSDEVWAKIVQDARDRRHLMTVSPNASFAEVVFIVCQIELSKTGGQLPIPLVRNTTSPVKPTPKTPVQPQLKAVSLTSPIPIMKPNELKKSISGRIPTSSLPLATPATSPTEVQPPKIPLKRQASGNLEPRPPPPPPSYSNIKKVNPLLKRRASDDIEGRPPPPAPGATSSDAGTSSTSNQSHIEHPTHRNHPPRRPKPAPSLFIPKKRP